MLFRGRFNREVRVSVNECPKTGICLGVRDLPGKPPQNHAQEDDGYAPDISLPRIIRFLAKDLRSKVWVTANDTSCRGMSLAWVVENSRSAKVDELDDVIRGHDAIVKLEVAVSEAHLVEVLNAVANLAEYAVNFWPAHFS